MFYPRSVDIIKTVLHLWMKGSLFQQSPPFWWCPKHGLW